MGKTPPFLIGRRKVVCKIKSHALEFGLVRLPLSNEQEKCCLHHLESCIGVWVGKIPLLLMGRRKVVRKYLESCTGVWVGKTCHILLCRRKVVCSIWSQAPEFGLGKNLPLLMGRR